MDTRVKLQILFDALKYYYEILEMVKYCLIQNLFKLSRAGNSLIGFPRESLAFCPKMSE